MESIKAYTTPASLALFDTYKVFSKRELESRYEVFQEDYHRRIHIEGEIALEMATNMIEPKVAEELGKLAKSLIAAKEAGLKDGIAAMTETAKKLGTELDALHRKNAALKKALKGLHEEILEAMADLRATVDGLEPLIPDESWPLPKYREMLFVY